MTTPTALFVCVKNGGKSQMAEALLRHHVGDRIIAESAGTKAGEKLNAESVESLAELGATMDGSPRQLTDEMLVRADRVIVIGGEAKVEPVEGMRAPIEVWETDEPSLRGIQGAERMRLVRDDIDLRVRRLARQMLGETGFQEEDPQ